MIKIYTDGSANKKSCGFGMVVFEDEELKFFHYDYCEESTNNREEMKAIIDAYHYIRDNGYNKEAIIYSDSAYCVNMLNAWIDNWQAAGWRKYDGGIILNQDLVMSLYALKHQMPNVKIEKTIGHAGVKGNEMADALAQGNLNKFNKLLTK